MSPDEQDEAEALDSERIGRPYPPERPLGLDQGDAAGSGDATAGPEPGGAVGDVARADEARSGADRGDRGKDTVRLADAAVIAEGAATDDVADDIVTEREGARPAEEEASRVEDPDREPPRGA